MNEISKGFEQIAREASDLGRSLDTFSWGKVALNALTIPLLGFDVDVGDSSQLDKVQIDDEWLGAVAGLPRVSKKGLRHLSDAIADKGWVSVREAMRFVEIEQKVQAAQMAEAEAEERRSSAGAAMLLARAERELPGTIGRIADGAKDLAEAATAMVVFTKEAALFTGRSAGAAAGWLRGLRT